ncbi:hypothetical protein [Pedobacter insulae]|uniref:Outer membrane protein beta-barrel domain-containing protein n=1 Tax=Pedobacter insulae TaxID=414048 RepID=A0A1I2VHG3_9SPHI|nr:hypothetical protein [Pedobacter insulae]SFG88523.1 hypothetical protein SAMN04489864_10336 [Pedobacter insulae]
MHKLTLKKLIFSLVTLLFAYPLPGFAQRSFLERIQPDQVNLQYAGSIGYFSGGVGYHFFKEKTTLSFHYGYVPEDKGGWMSIFTAKFEYKPFAIKIKDKFIIHPINPVFFPSYTSGDNFDYQFSTHKYRKGYYFWSSALRLHLGAGTEVKILNNHSSFFKSASVYAEANTNDLYAISWFQNRTSTPFYAMFKMGYGVRLNF